METNEIPYRQEKQINGDTVFEELKATLLCKIKEIQIEGEDGEATKTFEKKLQGSQVHRNQEESDLHGQIVKLYIKLIEKESDVEKLEAILYVCIKDLEIQMQLNYAVVEQLETALQEKGLKRVLCYQDTRIVEEVKRSLICFM